MSAVASMLGMAGASGGYDLGIAVMSFIVSMPGRVRLMILMAMVGMW
jgi:hypothetical protein